MKYKRIGSLLLMFALVSSLFTIPVSASDYEYIWKSNYDVWMNHRYDDGSDSWLGGTGSWADREGFFGEREQSFNVYSMAAGCERAKRLSIERFGNHFTSFNGEPLYLVESRVTVSASESTDGGYTHTYKVQLYWSPRREAKYILNGSQWTSTSALAGEYVSVAGSPGTSGYTFSGWTSTDVRVTNGRFPMPTTGATFTGTRTPRTDTPYTVEFYRQDLVNGGYDKQTADTITGRGTTDSQIRAALNMATLDGKYANCHLTDASKTDTTTIAGNGTAVLKLYYDYSAANVSYAYSGTIPAKAPAPPASSAQIFGTAVSVAAAPSLTGYDFSGWSTGDAAIAGGSFTMPVSDVVFTGGWTPRSDTP